VTEFVTSSDAAFEVAGDAGQLNVYDKIVIENEKNRENMEI